MDKENREKIEALITDKDFLQLQYDGARTNLFDIIGKGDAENWHSNFLKWLFDPKASHGLKGFPLECLFYIYCSKQDQFSNSRKVVFSEISEELAEGFKFKREPVVDYKSLPVELKRRLTKKSGRIDIFGENEKENTIIVIENKVTSDEEIIPCKIPDENGKSEYGQTELYFEYFENDINYERYRGRGYYIFLTPKGDTRAYDTHYVTITYQEIFDRVIRKCLDYPNLSEHARFILNEYSNNLRATIVENKPMAYVNKEMCAAIYVKHSDAFQYLSAVVGQDKNYKTEELKLFRTYKALINEVLLSVGQPVIREYPKKKPEGMDFVDLLCENGKLIPNDIMGELYFTQNGINYEVDVKKNDEGYYLEYGYYSGEYAVTVGRKRNGLSTALADSIKAATQKTRVNINGLDVLRNRDNKSPNDLWKEI